MPSNWAMVDNSFPTFTGEESPREQAEKLLDYMYILVEELKFQLSNLDANNWNEKALDGIKNDATTAIKKQMSLMIDEVRELKARVTLLQGLVAPDGTGGGTLGTAGQDLHLIGNIYINGKLME